jgi:mannose-1-phosphate guanylyltransferase
VAEPAADAGRVAVVPSSFRWEDIGDFDALATLLEAAGVPMSVLGDAGSVLAVDSTGLVVPAGNRVVAVVGLDDVVVVDTPDALLVTTRARAQEVKQAVAALKDSGRSALT